MDTTDFQVISTDCFGPTRHLFGHLRDGKFLGLTLDTQRPLAIPAYLVRPSGRRINKTVWALKHRKVFP